MRSRFLALVLVLAGPALPSSAAPAGAVRSVLARAIAAAPTYFASLIDRRRRHVMGDGRAIECDGGSQSLRWAGPGGSEIEAYASLNAEAGDNAISRSFVIIVTP